MTHAAPGPLAFFRRRAVRILGGLVLAGATAFLLAFAYFYAQFSSIVEQRLAGERDRVIPRVYARPLRFRTGQVLSPTDAVARLNDVGYAQRPSADGPGEFAVDGRRLRFRPRSGDFAGKAVAIDFTVPPAPARGTPRVPPPPAPPDRIATIQIDDVAAPEVSLDPPALTSLITGPRERRRRVALDAIPAQVQRAVLAIEDRRFYYHPGVDPIRMVGALVTNIQGTRGYLVGASTITQQLARNFFLTEEMAEEIESGQRSLKRKVVEQFVALILETKASKDDILELYLNDVYLGHRGSFAIHGMAEASRTFFGKDVTNLTLAEAALLAGVIQSPSNHSPFANPERARDRRNVVLRAMVDAGYVTDEAAAAAAAEPVTVVPRAIDNEAPYFVDYIGPVLDEWFPGVTDRTASLEVYTTLDLNMQRAAQDAVRVGLARVDEALARRGRKNRRPQAALVAVDPRTGEILAMVGGRSYNQSQFNRAVSARRQPGSTFKPFVYLAAFEQAALEGRTDLTPATLMNDEPTIWTYGEEEWAPGNFENEYEGLITLRRALALSKNMVAIKVAESIGFDRVADLWNRTGVGPEKVKGYPSIALGVSELTPLEVATAYTLFGNGGTIAPLTGITRVRSGDDDLQPPRRKGPEVARPDTTYLVTHMMRSVINEGTGASARGAGFTLDAAGKSGTTNDLRDAWFVGFTPEVLSVVWVGFDDNQPLGLSGSQAATPIWTDFMKQALAGRPNLPFEAPEGIAAADIDRDTGHLATPNCPRTMTEVFLSGTEPWEMCRLHQW